MQAGGGGGGADPAAPADAPAGAPAEHAHRSWSSRLPTTVVFSNSTQRAVEYAWLSFQGERTSYGTLEPAGTSPAIYTWTAHPWASLCFTPGFGGRRVFGCLPAGSWRFANDAGTGHASMPCQRLPAARRCSRLTAPWPPPPAPWHCHAQVFSDPGDPSALLVAGDDCTTFYAPPHVRPGPAPFPPVPAWHAELHPGVRARHLAGEPLTVSIREASRQAWAPALHGLAPPGFRAAARALLLCHQRLAAVPVVQARRQGQWHGRLRSSAARRCTLGDLHQARCAVLCSHCAVLGRECGACECGGSVGTLQGRAGSRHMPHASTPNPHPQTLLPAGLTPTDPGGSGPQPACAAQARAARGAAALRPAGGGAGGAVCRPRRVSGA